MVTHHPDELGAQLRRERLDQASELAVCRRFALIGQIAGEDDRIGTKAGLVQLFEQFAQPVVGVHRPVEPTIPPDEMSVADM
ncbi:Uncharacterised protein [Mycobacterium tuberculosis]|uniref:Uncharacterized protein n=1 Tax=Mycobacterium tuberculosis TaxID=1773 RepID=A0A655FW63_MYCTX|nr:Uncharacterised protein [Mycobacterium tuberculosis]CNW33546.1 Uncharacterised protein [Mycobacterium tuberculosis]